MSPIILHIDTSSFAKLLVKIDSMEVGIPVALGLGLNEGGEKVRTQIQRALKQQTNVKAYSSITKRITTIKAGPGRLSYDIVARGPGIPIKEFPVQLTSAGVDAEPWGVDHLFARSFGLRGDDPTGFRARRGEQRLPIRSLYGANLAKELGEGVVPSVFTFMVNDVVPAAIVRQLARIL